MKRSLLLSILLLSTTAGAQTAPTTRPAARISNAGFEEWDAKTNLPVGWAYWSEQKRYPAVSITRDVPAAGQSAMRAYLPLYDFVAIQQSVAVQPNTKYRITCKIRGTFQGRVALNVEPLAGMFMPIDDEWNFENAAWAEHSFEFETGLVSAIGVQFRFVGKGVVDVDDVRIEEVNAASK